MPDAIGSNPAGNITIQTFQAEAAENAAELKNEKATADASFLEGNETSTVAGQLRNASKNIQERIKTEKAQKQEAIQSVFLRKDPDDFADDFFKKQENKQYHLPKDKILDVLKKLAGILSDPQVNANSSPNTIRAAVIESLTEGGVPPAEAQVNKAFEFLMKATEGAPDTTLRDKVRQARDDYYFANQQRIEAGDRRIGLASALVEKGAVPGAAIAQVVDQEFMPQTTKVAEALGHLNELLEHPQDAITKLHYYEAKGYSVDDMKKEFAVIYRYMGERHATALQTTPDGPATPRPTNRQAAIPIESAERHQLIQEANTLRAIIHEFRFFEQQMPRVASDFARMNNAAA